MSQYRRGLGKHTTCHPCRIFIIHTQVGSRSPRQHPIVQHTALSEQGQEAFPRPGPSIVTAIRGTTPNTVISGPATFDQGSFWHQQPQHQWQNLVRHCRHVTEKTGMRRVSTAMSPKSRGPSQDPTHNQKKQNRHKEPSPDHVARHHHGNLLLANQPCWISRQAASHVRTRNIPKMHSDEKNTPQGDDNCCHRPQNWYRT